MQRLKPEEREIIIARVEMQQSYQQIAAAHGKADPGRREDGRDPRARAAGGGDGR